METRTYGIERLAKVVGYSFQHSPRLSYHNFQHEHEVARAALRLGEMEGLNEKDKFLLQTAAYLHDVIFDLDAKDNEERSADVAEKVLRGYNYDDQEILAIRGLIMVTKLPSKPGNLFEEIICDSDLDNLGTEEFFEKDKLLRKERGLEDSNNSLDWYMRSLDFLNGHRYYTESAKKIRNPGLAKNMAKVGEIIMRCPR